MKLLVYPLIFLVSLSIFSQEVEEEFTAIVVGEKEAFLSSKTGEYVYRSHADTNPMALMTTDNGVVYKEIKIHKVKAGESLYLIAKKLGISVSELKSQNKLKDNNLKIGQELQIVKHHMVKSSSPVVSQAEGRIIARLAPGQTPNGMTPPDLPPDAMPGATINLVVEKDAKDSSVKQEVESKVDNVADEAKEQISEDGTLIHTVKSGETLFSIARKYKVSMVDLKKTNNLALNTISTGQKLKVKVYNPAVLNQVAQPIKVEETRPIIEETGTIKVAASIEDALEEPVAEEAEVGTKEDVIEKVDKVKQDVIEEKSAENSKSKKEEIIDGLIEKYAKKDDTTASNEVEKSPNENIHIVKKGETLWGISKKYNMKVTELIELNELKSNSLRIGQKLKVK